MTKPSALQLLTLNTCLLSLVGCGAPGSAVQQAPGLGDGVSTAAPQRDVQPPSPTEADVPHPDADALAGLSRSLRDQRPTRRGVKVRALLTAHIARVERLVAVSAKSDPEHPKLLRGLAESYVDLAESATRERLRAEWKAQSGAGAYRQQAEQARRDAGHARSRAFAYFEALVRDHPKWCRHPNEPAHRRECVDEVLYYLGFDYERAGNIEKARKAYLRLLEVWPTSRFAVLAQLGLAELRYAKAMSERSKLREAEQLYRAVLEHSPPQNWVWGFAALRLAGVLASLGAVDEARAYAHAAADFAVTHAKLPMTESIRREAETFLQQLRP